MADIKISELTAALTVSDSDVLPMTASGSTVKVTTALLKEHAIGNTDISGIGDGTATGAIDSLNDEDTTIKAMIAPTETSPTANSWTTGAQFIWNDVLYDVIADITAGDALTVGTNIAPADTVVEQIEDAVADIAQNASDITTLGANKMSYAVNTMFGVHNIAPCTATGKTSNNVTFAISSDIVTATWSNTPTGDANLSYTSVEILSPKLVAGKTYSVSGCPSGGAWEAGNKKYILSVYNTTDGTFAAIDTGDGATFTPVEGKQYNLNITIGANAGASGSLTFAPMIKLEEDTDNTRVPYAMTNRELTEAVTQHTNAPILLTTAAANQTWATQLASLKTTYDTLTNPQKARCFISVNGYMTGLYRISIPNTGDFSISNVDSSGNVYIYVLRLSSQFIRRIQIATDGTVTSTDLSSNTQTYPLMLYLE